MQWVTADVGLLQNLCQTHIIVCSAIDITDHDHFPVSYFRATPGYIDMLLFHLKLVQGMKKSIVRNNVTILI